jgi:hypothetical protein
MLPSLLAIACKLPAYHAADAGPGAADGDDTASEASVDADNDGYDASVDCNDADSTVHPGTKETCGNGQDDNCNGSPDGCSWSGEGTLEGAELSGSAPEQLFGSALALCDANGDGQQDLAIAALGTSAYAGTIHLLYGPLGDDTAPTPSWTITGSHPEGSMGFSLDCRGDMDGDGAAELLIGEPDESGATAGTMYVVPAGETGVTSIADAFSSAWTGAYPGDRLGYGVAALDADGDGTDETAVTSTGGPYEATEYGVTYIVGSSPGVQPAYEAAAYVYGKGSQRLLGKAGNAGDMDGDGIEELAVTADVAGYPWDVVLLYQEPWTGALAPYDADVAIEGNASFVARATSLTHADVNGDGHDDFLIGNANDRGDAGTVAVFHGVVRDERTTDDADVLLIGRKGSQAGTAIASPGDLDGDGRAELLIGAPRDGGVYLHHGGEHGRYELDEAAQASWWMAEDTTDAGAALAVGDLTGDSFAEFAIGAPLAGDAQEGVVVLLPSFNF